MRNKILLGGLLWLAIIAVGADEQREENQLLKSWGLKFNASGKLFFQGEQKPGPELTPWQPDLSTYRSQPEQNMAAPDIQPLVVGSKRKLDDSGNQ
jgi:hypothetical protein